MADPGWWQTGREFQIQDLPTRLQRGPWKERVQQIRDNGKRNSISETAVVVQVRGQGCSFRTVGQLMKE